MIPDTLAGVPSRIRELGRLRMGETVPTKGGKSRPAGLEAWRVTSSDEALLHVVADLYGGEVRVWEGAPGVGRQWEVYTTAQAIPVLIPVASALSCAYEMWTADGCERRCNGVRSLIDDSPCVCPADIEERRALAGKSRPEACRPVTRLSVLLPEVPDLGVWRVEAHGYIAAAELPGTLALVLGLARTGAGPDADLSSLMVRASLAIERRTSKPKGQPRRDYMVPVIRTPGLTPDSLAGGQAPLSLGVAAPAPAQIGPGATATPGAEDPGARRQDSQPAAPPGSDSDELADDWDRQSIAAAIAALDDEHQAELKEAWRASGLRGSKDPALTKADVAAVLDMVGDAKEAQQATHKRRAAEAKKLLAAEGIKSADAVTEAVAAATTGAGNIKALSAEQLRQIEDYCADMAYYAEVDDEPTEDES